MCVLHTQDHIKASHMSTDATPLFMSDEQDPRIVRLMALFRARMDELAQTKAALAAAQATLATTQATLAAAQDTLAAAHATFG